MFQHLVFGIHDIHNDFELVTVLNNNFERARNWGNTAERELGT